MASTDTWIKQSPGAGSIIEATNCFAIEPTGSTSVSVTCKAFNSVGGLVTVPSFTAYVLTFPGGAVKNSFTGTSVNTVSVTYTAVGGDILAGGFQISSAAGVDHITVDCTYTGSEYPIFSVWNGSSWATFGGTQLRVWNGSAWVPLYGGVSKWNGSVWVAL